MIFSRYRQVLAAPGVAGLMLVTLVARIPLAAASVLITLHVVQNLDRGYGAAGLVTTTVTIGIACGAPLLGRLVDRKGLRPAMLIATLGEAVLWVVAPGLAYWPLVVFAGVASLLTLPASAVARQCLAALVAQDRHRQAFACDSMSVEISYMLGPPLGVVLITQCSARVAMSALGLVIVAAGIALIALNPPVRPPGEDHHTVGGAVRARWFTSRMLVPLAVTVTATTVIGACEVAVVADLRSSGDAAWAGVVIGVWSATSLVGGFVFGAVHRPVSPALLVGLLAVTAVPVGLATGWQWLALAIVPTGFCCAPAIVATTHAVSRLAPAHSAGEVMGWYSFALTAGISFGAPAAGLIIDRSSPTWGFAIVGAATAVVAGVLGLIERSLPTDPGDLPDRSLDRSPGHCPDRPGESVSSTAGPGNQTATAADTATGRLAEEVSP